MHFTLNGKKGQQLVAIVIVVILILIIIWPNTGIASRIMSNQKIGVSALSDNECSRAGKDETFYRTVIRHDFAILSTGTLSAPETEQKKKAIVDEFKEFVSCYKEPEFLDIKEENEIEMGVLLYNAQDKENARYFFKSYYSKNGDKKDDNVKQALYYISTIYFESGAYDLAVENLDKLDAMPPVSWENEREYIKAISNFRIVQAEGGDINSAIGLLDSYYKNGATPIVKKNQIESMLALYYYSKQDWVSVRTWLERIMNNDEQDKFARMQAKLQMGYLYWAMSKNGEYARNQDEKIQFLWQAIGEFSGYEGFLSTVGFDDLKTQWKEAKLDLALSELCTVQLEYANNQQTKSADDYKKAIETCERVIVYGAESYFTSDAKARLAIIKENCLKYAGGCS